VHRQRFPWTLLLALSIVWIVETAPPERSTAADKDERPTVVNSLGMKFVLIRKGDFQMGSEEFPSERPPRQARVTKDFFLAIHHVTVGQFRSFVKDAGYQTDAEKDGKGAEGFDRSIPWTARKAEFNWKNPGFAQGDDHPVVCVSWNDALAFCQWLSKKDGKTYRLPTDRELEYAIRAGTTTHWSCGDTPESLKGYANCADLALVAGAKLDQKKLTERNAGLSPVSSGIATWDDGYAFTSPVGALKPNPWGLHDMHGNAWQWCLEVMLTNRPTKDPLFDPEDVVALAKGTGNRKIRGGTWWLGPGRCRSANWANRTQGDSFCYVGFRVVRAAE
jgi:formylglycine-generating enzyme required for sulfatase activity